MGVIYFFHVPSYLHLSIFGNALYSRIIPCGVSPGFFIDALYALYTVRVTEKKALQSATFGSLIHVLTAFTVISYTKNYQYLIPLVIGSFVGTYLAVTYTKRKSGH